MTKCMSIMKKHMSYCSHLLLSNDQALEALCEQAEVIFPLGSGLPLSRIAWNGVTSICATHRMSPKTFVEVAVLINPGIDKASAIELLVLAYLRAERRTVLHEPAFERVSVEG
jgi:hypothetical protein